MPVFTQSVGRDTATRITNSFCPILEFSNV